LSPTVNIYLVKPDPIPDPIPKQNGAKSVEHIIKALMPYGQDKVDRFQKWVEMFN
jgi:hypothetical protein